MNSEVDSFDFYLIPRKAGLVPAFLIERMSDPQRGQV
jgi:hypothetical protein